MTVFPAIDSHFHIWDPAKGDYSWQVGPFAVIHRVFTADDFARAVATANVVAGVLVQTWHSLDETREFLSIADSHPAIAGVVGWVDLTAGDVGEVLDDLLTGPGGHYLKSIRHLVHNEEDAEWLGRPDVRRGLLAVADRGLAFDLLIRPREIPASIALAKAMPDLRLVVDHIAKPAIASNGFDAWAGSFSGFADLPNVSCKLSGMVTEADFTNWSAEGLRPYFEHAIAVFGPERLMVGSDWPVCLVATDYAGSINLVRDAIAHLAPTAQHAVLFETANAFYRLGLENTHD